MASNIITASGPLFGPDFVEVVVNDATGRQYTVQVFPDATNAELKAAGLATHYYWQPSRVTLARKEATPEDFAFGMTVFKGLMTDEDTLGIAQEMMQMGAVEAGGGFCSFTTTMGLPDSVIANVRQALKASAHPAPPARLGGLFFRFRDDDPDPELGIMPILEANVTIEVPPLNLGGNPRAPMLINAQGAGKGSIEAHGFNSYLVTCNQMAAGAIAGSLKGGVSPFTFHYDLKELAYIHGCQVTVTVDVDKTFDQFSAALDVGGFLGINDASLEWAWSRMLTSGAVTTHMVMDGANLPDELKKWVEQSVDDMRKTAFDLVKKEIFDWNPTEQAPAQTSGRGLFSRIFGGSSVSLKSNHQRRSIKFDQQLVLDSTIEVHNTISGTLDDLLPAVRDHLDRYLIEVDIGEFFRKVQVAATSAVKFDAALPDGTPLREPIAAVQLEVSYPDFVNPGGNGAPLNLSTRSTGFHYLQGHREPTAGNDLAMWRKGNPEDIVNISFLRLTDAPPEWPANQVGLRKTIIYDGSDPRVDFAGNRTQIVIEQLTQGHAPVLSTDEVGYVFVRFFDANTRKMPSNVTARITATIGDRTDTLDMSTANENGVIWEIFSDKYLALTEFTYTLDVRVDGPEFFDEPVEWSSPAPIRVALEPGRLKTENVKVDAMRPPDDKLALVNQYLKAVRLAEMPAPALPATMPPAVAPPMPSPMPPAPAQPNP